MTLKQNASLGHKDTDILTVFKPLLTGQDRLAKLIMLTMLAFVWCYKIGDYIDQYVKPIVVKKHGRRAKSIFRLGLDTISRYLLSGVNRYNLNFLKFLSCT